MPSLTRLTTGGVFNPPKNTTKIGHNELLHQEPLQPPLEPSPRHDRAKASSQSRHGLVTRSKQARRLSPTCRRASARASCARRATGRSPGDAPRSRPQPRPPGHTRSPARSATALRPTQRGVCTIRRIATACRRRVAPLMAQFPPFARARTTATPPSAPPSPLARASNTTPAAAHRATPRRPTGGFAPLDASLRRVAGVSQP